MKYLLMLLVVLCIGCGRKLPCFDEVTTCVSCGTSLIGINPNCNLGCPCDECSIICPKCGDDNRCLPLHRCKKKD